MKVSKNQYNIKFLKSMENNQLQGGLTFGHWDTMLSFTKFTIENWVIEL